MTAKPSGKPIALVLLAWLVVAIALGVSGRLRTLRPPVPQLVVVVLTVACLAAVLLVRRFRVWSERVPIRTLVAVHLVRFIGCYFLVLAARGLLAPAFAVPAGWGDIGIATLAAVLLALVSPGGPVGRRCYLGWNVLGLLDILFVIATAARVGLASPESMRPLLQLPLSLLPTFIVPIIISTHILLFLRLARSSDENCTATQFRRS